MFEQTDQRVFTFLVPLDGSGLAESVFPAVEALASRCQARVILLHILEQRPPTSVHGERHLTNVAEAVAYLETTAARLRASGIATEVHVHEKGEDDVARSIAEHASELHVDLVILCTHGRGGLRGFLFGSIAQQALQRGTLSILLVRPASDGSAPPLTVRRILVPLDGTSAHEPALPAAITIAQLFSAPLHLVMVIPTLATLTGEQARSGLLLPTTMTAVLDLAEQGAAEYLERALARVRAEGVEATAEVLRGDTVLEVLALARRSDASLIVMGSHGRAGLRALLAGSVSTRIAEKVTTPLLLVRASSQTEEGATVGLP